MLDERPRRDQKTSGSPNPLCCSAGCMNLSSGQNRAYRSDKPDAPSVSDSEVVITFHKWCRPFRREHSTEEPVEIVYFYILRLGCYDVSKLWILKLHTYPQFRPVQMPQTWPDPILPGWRLSENEDLIRKGSGSVCIPRSRRHAG